MGVISHDKISSAPVHRSNEELMPSEFLIESPFSTDVEDEEVVDDLQRRVEALKACRKLHKLGQPRLPNLYTRHSVNKRHWGARRLRRYENDHHVGSYTDLDDIYEDLSDMIPDTTTAFTQLFNEHEKMKTWIDFTKKSEEDQRVLLRKYSSKDNDHRLDFISNNQATCSKPLDVKLVEDTVENRFRKIDRGCRFLLSHKSSILPKLGKIEEQLIDYFDKNPAGVFMNRLESGFDRLLLHASAQYLLLKSISFSDELNVRQTKIVNPKSIFIRPPETMATYLSRVTQNGFLADVNRS